MYHIRTITPETTISDDKPSEFVTPEMVHEAWAHVPFAITDRMGIWAWVSDFLNRAIDAQQPKGESAEPVAWEKLREEWRMGEYDNGEHGCLNCGRSRLCLCPNGKHRCEKCNWSPELGTYAPFNDN